MKILFIFPPKKTHAIESAGFYKKLDKESGLYPPLGILYVASYLKKYSEHCVEIIDAPAENYDFQDIEKEIIKRKPDVVGIYFCTDYLLDSFKTAAIVKRVNSKIAVIAGGPHIYIYPQETISNPNVDYCIYGEGEIVLTNLIEALFSCKSPEKIEGVISKNNTAKKQELQKTENLDKLPFPDRKLLPYTKYKSFITYSNPITTMMTSRGCAYNCHFCTNIERGQRVRMRSPRNVVDEIEEILRIGIRDILFFDENFTYNMERVRLICEEIINRKIKIRWHCRSRADMKFEKEVLKKMKDAGCRMVQLGIETGTQNLQERINKKLNLEKVKQLVKDLKNSGILSYGNFIIGFPGESKKEMLQTITFAMEAGFDYAPFSIFNPLPISYFYTSALQKGIIKDDYWMKYAKNPEKQVIHSWWPEQDFQMLQEISAQAFRMFYFRIGQILKLFFLKQSIRQKWWQLKSAVKLFVIPKVIKASKKI
ncbi:MAG: radical SAM protein [Elusimicrobia bacterium]|nr:radical SAM protein [Elusimicrobiota bacterium]